MSEAGLYKPSPLIQKIINQKFPKLNSESLKTIVDRARQMTKLTQPSNCSQNLKAEFQDPEKALEYSRRKNMIFDSYLKHELSQLHCSKSPVRAPVRTRRKFFKSFDLSTSPGKSSEACKQAEPAPARDSGALAQLAQLAQLRQVYICLGPGLLPGDFEHRDLATVYKREDLASSPDQVNSTLPRPQIHFPQKRRN